jgi:glycosyltransferase involved in cell wall biosynthesis
MRIGFFSWESLYSIKVGGIAPHVSELSEALARLGHEVHIFTRRGDFDAYDRINGVHYQRVPSDPRGDIVSQMDDMCAAFLDRFAGVQKIFGKFDIIHGHDWHPVLSLNHIKAEYGLPYALTIHSTEWGRNGNNFSHENISKTISHREWLGGYESSQIIVTTRLMLDELKKLYSIPEDKINIIPNGIVSGKIRSLPKPEETKKKLGIDKKELLVLFCGRMSYQKGPDLLVEAIPLVLKTNRNAKFVFAGEGDLRPRCEYLTRKFRIQNSCIFLGHISGAEKEKLISACDIMCVPSRNEPFGMVVLDAWDASKPVVATMALSIIKNYEDGLLAYIEPESIAWCLNRLMENPEEGGKMGKSGRGRLKMEFNWDQIAKKTEYIYENIIKGHRIENIKI